MGQALRRTGRLAVLAGMFLAGCEGRAVLGPAVPVVPNPVSDAGVDADATDATDATDARDAGEDASDAEPEDARPDGITYIDADLDACSTPVLEDAGGRISLACSGALGGTTTAFLETLGGVGSDYVEVAWFDPCGNTIFNQSTWTALDVDPGPSVVLVTPAHRPGYILRALDPDGALRWYRNYEWDSSHLEYRPAQFAAVHPDPDGNIVLTGATIWTDFDGEPWGDDEHTVINGFGNTGFLVKIAPDGTTLWVRSILSTLGEGATTGLSVDGDGDIYFAGTYDGETNFSPLHYVPDARVPSPAGRGWYGTYVAHFSSGGAFRWVTTLEGTSWGRPSLAPVAVDGVGGIYAGGSFYISDGVIALRSRCSGTSIDPIPGSPNSAHSLLVKLNTAGVAEWVVKFISSENAGGSSVSHLAVTPDGDILAAGGHPGGELALEGPLGAESLSTPSGDSAYVARFGPDGTLRWFRSFPNLGLSTLVSRADGEIVLGGGFYAQVDFDPGAAEALRAPAGVADAFVLRLESDGEFVDVTTWSGGDGGASISDLGFDQDDNLYATGQYDGATFEVTLAGNVHSIARQTTLPGHRGDGFLLKSPWPI